MTMNGSQPAGTSLPLDLRRRGREAERKGSREDELSRPESPGARAPSRQHQAKREAAASRNGLDDSAASLTLNALQHSPSSSSRTPTQQAPSRAEPDLGEASGAGDSKHTKKLVSSLPLRKRPFPAEPDARHLSGASRVDDRGASPEQNRLSPDRGAKKRKLGHLGERTEAPRRHDRTPADAAQRLPDAQTYISYRHPFGSFTVPPMVMPLVPVTFSLHHIERDHWSQEVALATQQDNDGDTALHIAVVQGLEDVVHRLICILAHAGRDLDIYNNLMQTPLHLAVITHQTNLVQALLNAGADPGTLDRNGQTAAHLCCEHSLRSCLALILDYPTCQSCLKVRNYEESP